MRKKITYGIVLALVAVVFATVPMCASSEEPEPPPSEPAEPPLPDWMVEGNGTYFEITNSTYLNITLTSSEIVRVYLESVPNVISYSIESESIATSTDLTFTGFEASKTYYRYQDGHLQEEFTTDESGSYFYTQDLTISHHVFIQEEGSTLYIRDDATGGDGYLIGDWDWPTKTLTLTTDVFETIVIDSGGITLDGGGHSVTYGAGSHGIYVHGETGVTITNAVVSGFSVGIYLDQSGSSTISGNTVSGNMYGLWLSRSNGNTVSGNTISDNTYCGISLYQSGSGTISGNIVLNNDNYGIVYHSSSGCTISGNAISDNTSYGIYHYYSCSSTISGNTVSGNKYGIYLQGSSSCTISGNTVSGGVYGIRLLASGSNTISGNTASGNTYGILLYDSSSCTISGNTVSGNTFGITLYQSGSSTISENTVSGSDFGIYLRYSSSSTIIGNTVSGNAYGIYLRYQSSNNIFHNNIIDNIYQAYDSDPASNEWHHPELLEGNYWSDYTGLDDGSNGRIAGDGIGDTNIPHPYTDQGNGYYQLDNYPLMSPWSPNEPPEILSITGPGPVQINTEMSISGTFTDPDDGDTHTAEWSWGDISTSDGTVNQDEDTVSGTHTYDSVGIYIVTLTVTDSHDESDTMDYHYVVVFDPEGGFVTGGGWIDSPTGASSLFPDASGKANFGFVSKYKKGADTPTGNTQFQFKAGDLDFHSSMYQWLVVAGPKAQFKGTGTINGEEGYGFMLTAVDGEINGGGGEDKFRIKIWDTETDTIIYDNQGGADDANPTTTLGGGSIMIHTKG